MWLRARRVIQIAALLGIVPLIIIWILYSCRFDAVAHVCTDSIDSGMVGIFICLGIGATLFISEKKVQK